MSTLLTRCDGVCTVSLMKKEAAEIYKAQTIAVESLLDHHPDFDPALDPRFSAKERAVFAEVFQPDWSKYNEGYLQAFDHFRTKEPDLMLQAQAVLRKFLLAHGVDLSELGL